MAAMQAVFPQHFPDPLEKLILFLSPSKSGVANLPSSTLDSMNGIGASMTAIVRHVISCATSETFKQRLEASLPKYAKLVIARGMVARVELDNEKYAFLACDSLNRLSKQFEAHGVREFGADVSDQLSFFVFTCKRILRIIPRMAVAPAPSFEIAENRDAFLRFMNNFMISQFSFDCLREIVLNHAEVTPEVISAVVENLGLCAVAYASLRVLAESRADSVFGSENHSEWDEEDQALLNESEYSGTSIT